MDDLVPNPPQNGTSATSASAAHDVDKPETTDVELFVPQLPAGEVKTPTPAPTPAPAPAATQKPAPAPVEQPKPPAPVTASAPVTPPAPPPQPAPAPVSAPAPQPATPITPAPAAPVAEPQAPAQPAPPASPPPASKPLKPFVPPPQLQPLGPKPAPVTPPAVPEQKSGMDTLQPHAPAAAETIPAQPAAPTPPVTAPTVPKVPTMAGTMPPAQSAQQIPAAPAPGAPNAAAVAPLFATPAPTPKATEQSEIDKILLPKEGPSLDTLVRAPAADVLKAANAPLPQPEKPKEPIAPLTQQPVQKQVPVLRTFPADVAAATQSGKFDSLAKIAAAPKRKVESKIDTPPTVAAAAGAQERPLPEHSHRLLHIIEAVGGSLLFLGALGLLIVAFWHPILPSQPIVTATPFMYVDDTKVIPFDSTADADQLKQALNQDREGLQLSLGLVSQFVLSPGQGTTTLSISTQQFFQKFAPDAPDSLVRALAPSFLLGVHAFDGNQPFLVFKTDSYSQAFAGMLAWEPLMQQDLNPLFVRDIGPKSADEASTTVPVAPKFLQTPFVDSVVENHDARIVENQSGDVLLLWTFIDPQTLVITTDPYTLREIISRLSRAPTAIIPSAQ